MDGEEIAVIRVLLTIVVIASIISIVTAQPAPVATSPGPQSADGSGGSNTAGIVGGLLGGLLGLGILLCFLYMKCIRKPKPPKPKNVPTSAYVKTGFLRPSDESEPNPTASKTAVAASSVPATGSRSVEEV